MKVKCESCSFISKSLLQHQQHNCKKSAEQIDQDIIDKELQKELERDIKEERNREYLEETEEMQQNEY